MMAIRVEEYVGIKTIKEYEFLKDEPIRGTYRIELSDEKIIRCYECKWFKENASPDDPDGRYYFCVQHGFDFEGDNGFCAWAERRQ